MSRLNYASFFQPMVVQEKFWGAKSYYRSAWVCLTYCFTMIPVIPDLLRFLIIMLPAKEPGIRLVLIPHSPSGFGKRQTILIVSRCERPPKHDFIASLLSKTTKNIYRCVMSVNLCQNGMFATSFVPPTMYRLTVPTGRNLGWEQYRLHVKLLGPFV